MYFLFLLLTISYIKRLYKEIFGVSDSVRTEISSTEGSSYVFGVPTSSFMILKVNVKKNRVRMY